MPDMARASVSVRETVGRFRLPLPQRWRRLMARYVGAQEQHSRLVLAVQVGYVLIFLLVFFLGSDQWPAAPDLITVGLLGFAVVTARGIRFLRDWTPFLVLTIGYLALPGLTPGLQQRAHVGFPITVDRWLGGGELPTTRLQAALWKGGQLQWYDYAASALYLLHFVVPLVLAYLFWHWRRPLYVRFVRAYLVLMYAGFTIYLLYPMAPPWWASDLGRIPHVAPVLSLVHWKGIGNPVGILTGTFQPDPVAAMPSMHAAFSMLVGLVLWSLRPRWAWIALAYPLAMATTVLYTGDHYVIDMLVGWAFALAAFVIVWLRWQEKQAAAPRPVPAPVADEQAANAAAD
ncbi:MAG TPA: phosphatase PAP2 family protein [Dehalococcoidia bacterium]|nr:phosphatase PAP2 family protein [Dehalococcoidia bacterium]